jgi:hypothetical protein
MMDPVGLTSRNNHPWRIEPNIIHPKVQEFRSVVDKTPVFLVYVARRVVKGHAVQVSQAHDDLQGVPQTTAPRDGHGRRKA